MMVNSIVGHGSYFRGKFIVKGSLKIEGKFRGDAIQVDNIFIGVKGEVKTNIYANNVDVEGLIVGNIEAKNRIFLRPTSRVLGNIKTKELIIQNGVVLQGECIIGGEGEKMIDLKRKHGVRKEEEAGVQEGLGKME